MSSRDIDHVAVIADIHGDSLSLIRTLWMISIALNQSLITASGGGSSNAFNRFYDIVSREAQKEDIYMPKNNSRNMTDRLSSIPARTVLVQVGDVVDRGPDGLLCLQILHSLPRLFGWTVVRLYGNHELMNYLGQADQFIHPREDLEYGLRFQPILDTLQITSHQEGGSLVRKGLFQGGPVWTSITNKSVLLARIGDETHNSTFIPPLSSISTLFVHGGIDMNYLHNHFPNITNIEDPEELINELNQEVHRIMTTKPELLTQDKKPENLNFFDSPLWTRDLAQIRTQYVCDRLLPTILGRFNVARLVIGHTPQMDRRMKSMCDSRLILADAAMSKWMHKQNWSVNEDEDDFELDSDGFSIQGNPSFLLLEKNQVGNCKSINAYYYDMLEHKIESVNFFKESNLDYLAQVSPGIVPPEIATVSHVAAPFESPSNDVVFVATISYPAISHRLYPHKDARRILLYIQQLESRIHGVPEILDIGANLVSNDPATNTHALFKFTGVATRVHLARFPFVAHMFRQIVDTVTDLFTNGIVFQYTSKSVSHDILEYFMVETNTMLMKLVNYESCRFRHVTDFLEIVLAEVVIDLNGVARKAGVKINVPRMIRDIVPNVDYVRFKSACETVLSRHVSKVPAFATPTKADLDLIYSSEWMVLHQDAERTVSFIRSTGMFKNRISIKDKAHLSNILKFAQAYNTHQAQGHLGAGFTPLRISVVAEASQQVAYLIFPIAIASTPNMYREMRQLDILISTRAIRDMTVIRAMILEKVRILHRAQLCLFTNHDLERVLPQLFMFEPSTNHLVLVDYARATVCEDASRQTAEMEDVELALSMMTTLISRSETPFERQQAGTPFEDSDSFQTIGDRVQLSPSLQSQGLIAPRPRRVVSPDPFGRPHVTDQDTPRSLNTTVEP